eukprot:12316839-Alexandrium_andersonii.AAC.1
MVPRHERPSLLTGVGWNGPHLQLSLPSSVAQVWVECTEMTVRGGGRAQQHECRLDEACDSGGRLQMSNVALRARAH